MATFFMFGKYTCEAIREVSIERTQEAVNEIEKLGGEFKSMHALLGEYDLLFCVNLPSVDDAIKASVRLAKLTSISFTTCPAMSIEAFDRITSVK